MMLLQAFITCGLLCAFFQLIVSVTRWNPQYVLIGSISLGAILMPFGITGLLEGFGGAGMIATFMDAGSAFAGTLVAGFTTGSWAPFLIILFIVVLQIPCGIWAGSRYVKNHSEKSGDYAVSGKLKKPSTCSSQSQAHKLL